MVLPVSAVPAARASRLPRRDARARAALGDAARAGRPLVLARDRVLAVSGPVGELLPGAGIVRGSVVVVDGAPGCGVTSLTFELAAAATRLGEWAVVVDPQGTLGGLAAGEVGVALERFALVRDVPVARWATVVAALLDGLSVVIAAVPRSVRAGDAHRLVARARERDAVLVAVGPWPAQAALRLRAEAVTWSAPDHGPGLLGERTARVTVTGRGVAPQAPAEVLARVG
ncbi:MAG TPA: hypothetical protein VFD41_07145 [Actinomycetales bacterium]|nr:hypothetical protein [Actinomycetales bacterium]